MTETDDTLRMQAQIEQDRAELSETVEALTERLDVKARLEDKREEIKDNIRHRAEEVRDQVRDRAEEVMERAEEVKEEVWHRAEDVKARADVVAERVKDRAGEVSERIGRPEVLVPLVAAAGTVALLAIVVTIIDRRRGVRRHW